MKINWNDLIKVLAAVLIFGAGWTVDNQMVIITAVAVAIVWLLAFVANQFNWHPGKAVLTGFLFIAAIGLSLIFSPVLLPPFPAWSGDLVSYAPLFLVYLGALLAIAGPVVAYATGVYNILLAQVLGNVSNRVAAFFSRKPAATAGRKR